jgi:exodeoxyribonuclease VII large subunit
MDRPLTNYTFKGMQSPDPFASQLDLSFDEPVPSRRIWPVREIVAQVRDLVEQKYGDVWVEGEISNYRPAPSGHVYFTLKDAEAQLPIVLFRRQAMLLRFRPEDGLHVLVRGRVSVYEQRGQMQLVAETMEPVGAGSLQLAFEQLKERLKAEGLFDVARKRPLPAFPRTVGIVTSPTGAVIRDFLNIVSRRHSGLSVLLCPVSVQGEQAPAEIESAIARLNEAGLDDTSLVDVIVLARGGGSLEDLAAFNSERVARAIAASRLPIVSAIGHETDFTIADFVADLRAPTPSAAAELITEAQHKIVEYLAAQSHRLDRAARFQLLQARQHLTRSAAADRTESRVSALLRRLAQRLDDLSFRLESALTTRLHQQMRSVADLTAAVLRHDPRQNLARASERLAACRTRLDRSLERVLQRSRVRFGTLDARLHSLSPLAVLDRGYALVLSADGNLIRSTSQLAPGDQLTTRLSDGAFTSRVESPAPNPPARGSHRPPRGNKIKK